jgi:hypothetical protein
LTVNPTSLGGFVFLPIMTTPEPCYPGPWESEPNDSRAQANGPLCFGVQYMGSPNDSLPNIENDYFYFDLPANGPVTVLVTNFLPIGQLQLIAPNDLVYVADQSNGTYQIHYTGPAGRYYARLVALPGHPVGQNYMLRVTRP